MFGKVKTVDFHTSFSRRVAKTFPKHLLTAEYYAYISIFPRYSKPRCKQM